MNLIIYIVTIFSFISCGNSSGIKKTDETGRQTAAGDIVKRNIPAGLQKLVTAYPDFLDSAGENILYWKDGDEMPWDDGITGKTHEEMLDNPDLEDMMSQQYEKGSGWSKPPAENFEPGRIRYEPFFKKMYGSTQSEVKKNLVTVNWLPSVCGCRVQVNSVNNMSEKLQAVSDEIEATLGAEFHKYLSRTGGTFNWRNIAGTNRLSTHAFGTSIDINTNYSNYWKWEGSMEWKNKIPFEIVEIFEKHGFIWGGKWYHYDTMHFEYRPELITD